MLSSRANEARLEDCDHVAVRVPNRCELADVREHLRLGRVAVRLRAAVVGVRIAHDRLQAGLAHDFKVRRDRLQVACRNGGADERIQIRHAQNQRLLQENVSAIERVRESHNVLRFAVGKQSAVVERRMR